MVGGWEISNADRDRRCPMTFSVEPAPGGYKIDLDAELRHRLSVARQRRGLELRTQGCAAAARRQGRRGARVHRGRERHVRIRARREGLLFLQTQAAFKVETRTADQIVGDWSLLREADKPLCRLTLSEHRRAATMPTGSS